MHHCWLWRSAWCLLRLNKWIFKCKQIFEHLQFNCALWTFITWLILRRMIYYTLYLQCISTNNAGKKTWCWINAIRSLDGTMPFVSKLVVKRCNDLFLMRRWSFATVEFIWKMNGFFWDFYFFKFFLFFNSCFNFFNFNEYFGFNTKNCRNVNTKCKI